MFFKNLMMFFYNYAIFAFSFFLRSASFTKKNLNSYYSDAFFLINLIYFMGLF